MKSSSLAATTLLLLAVRAITCMRLFIAAA
jgi:hypothetical protein